MLTVTAGIACVRGLGAGRCGSAERAVAPAAPTAVLPCRRPAPLRPSRLFNAGATARESLPGISSKFNYLLEISVIYFIIYNLYTFLYMYN